LGRTLTRACTCLISRFAKGDLQRGHLLAMARYSVTHAHTHTHTISKVGVASCGGVDGVRTYAVGHASEVKRVGAVQSKEVVLAADFEQARTAIRVCSMFAVRDAQVNAELWRRRARESHSRRVPLKTRLGPCCSLAFRRRRLWGRPCLCAAVALLPSSFSFKACFRCSCASMKVGK
jgi:hypothetical protein